MSQMFLSQLPTDAMHYILIFCGILDSLSFSLICKTTYALQSRRSFWITALKNERFIRPIACPFHEDLSQLSLVTLRGIALHTLRLKHNWSLANPQIVGNIKKVSLGMPRLDFVFQVPGTDLYLLHARATGSVEIWNVKLGKRVGKPLYVARRLVDVSPGEDLPGIFSMGLLTSDEFAEMSKLAVICLDYYNPHGISLNLTFETELLHNEDVHFWAAFMDADIVGSLFVEFNSTSYLCIVAWNRSTKMKTLIQTDILRDAIQFEVGHSATSLLNGDLALLVEHPGQSCTYIIPKIYFPRKDNPDCPPTSHVKCADAVVMLQWDYDHYESDSSTEAQGALTADTTYGIPAVSLHQVNIKSPIQNWKVNPHIEVKFWADTQYIGASNGRLLPMHPIFVPGILHDSADSSWQLMLLPHSGRKVLLVVNHEDRVGLQLVSCELETGKVTCHNIDVPSSVDLSAVHGLSLDDHRGVISVLDTKGVLHAMSFA